MDGDRKLTKKEKKEFRKLEWAEKTKLQERNDKIKKNSIWAAAILVIILSVAGLFWLVTTPTPSGSSIKVPEISTKDITNGEINGKVSLIEYSDFQCPACASYNPFVKQLLSDYKGEIYYAYRFFPLTNIHKNALISSQAGYAAYKQGKFFEMGDILFANQKDWAEVKDPTSIFIEYAKKVGLDIKKFDADMNSDEAKKIIKAAENQAISLRINSTPTFFVNGVNIQNPANYGDFKKSIDYALSQK